VFALLTPKMAKLSDIKSATSQEDLDEAAKSYLVGLTDGRPPLSVKSMIGFLDLVHNRHEALGLAEMSDDLTSYLSKWQSSLTVDQQRYVDTASKKV
jgi:hypothetical protein